MNEVKLQTPASRDMLRWQLSRLYSELLLLSAHVLDKTCPCELSTETSEYCVPKHGLVIIGYCMETIPMTDNLKLRDILGRIQAGMSDFNREYEEAPEDKRPYDQIAQWAREARKELEPYLWRYKQPVGMHQSLNVCSGNRCSNTGNEINLAMPAPFGWPGGKRQLSRTIVDLIPPHKTYVEPFAGAAWVFWRKEPSEVEVLNDLDPDLIRFYQNIENIRHCNTSLISRDWKGLKAKEGKLEPCQFLTQVECSYGDKRGSKDKSGNNLTSCLSNLPQFHHYLPQYQERLKSVKLHNEDWRKVVERYDAPDTFFYLDPPYHGTNRYYRFSGDQLAKLAEVLPKLKGKWLLSYDDHPDVRQAFSSFSILPVDSHYTLSGGWGQEVKELLIANYPLNKSGGEVKMAEFKQDPVLAEVASQICSSGICLGAKGRSRLPVCSADQAKKLEACILDVKAKIKETGYKGNPYAICRTSLGCRRGGSPKYEVKVA